MRTNAAVFFLFLFSGVYSYSQNSSIEAVRISQAPKIDGVLDDAAWKNAPVATNFIQNSPNVGAAANQKSEVKIVYDNNAIYIGAYLYDDPNQIRKQFTARDDEGQKDVDYFSVFFDTYHDRQNGFQFLVTSANVQSDAKLDPNAKTEFGSYGDKTWEAVWNSEVSIKSDGWVVEMRIPYLSLRFPKADIQSWGLQFLRFVRRNNERSFWKEVKPEINGFTNQFGDFNNLKDLKPPLRLSFSPYVSTGIRSSPDDVDGFHKTWLRNGGMDIKYGLNESFTLDATLIPDFGQVVSDNVVNNLTPYEQKFTENRPFFTEGTELFNKAGLFYSRRIGRTPSKYFTVRAMGTDPNIEIEKNPSVTQLINAIKFSGRNEKRLGIGVFNAVGAPMHAIIRNKTTGERTKIETEPLANYNILVFDQALKGRSYISFTNTNVIRNGSDRDANVSAVDFAAYNKKSSHVFQGTARYSKIWAATSLDGYNTTFKYSKVSGSWRYSLSNNIVSENYNPNDLGILTSANKIVNSASFSYKQFTPTRNFITYSHELLVQYNLNYNPRAYSTFRFATTSFWLFKNFWDISLSTIIVPVPFHDYYELQTPGKFIRYRENYQSELSGSSDSRKKFYFEYAAGYSVSPAFDNKFYHWKLGSQFRFSNKFTLGIKADKTFEEENRGYAFLRETNGDPIAGKRDLTNFETILTGIFNFTSRQNLTLRARHYWNKVIYNKFYNIDVDGNFVDRASPVAPGGNDENFNLFNVDAFFTWDFRLGSRLIIGYKNWLGENEYIDGTLNKKYLNNLGELFKVRHGNELTLRFIYFLDYNQLRKKR